MRSCGGGGGGGGEEVFGGVKGSEEVEVEVDGSLLELHNQPIVPNLKVVDQLLRLLIVGSNLENPIFGSF